ncbi:MAG: hypothetical protein KAQ79_05640 [Cyclobacteriaceae bacterium]|nr:hypothetical protein [Cyclobacteriaceae bacterium]
MNLFGFTDSTLWLKGRIFKLRIIAGFIPALVYYLLSYLASGDLTFGKRTLFV